MAYTSNWDNNAPPGSRAAKEIDNAIRELTLRLHERLLTILDPSIDFDTDPWRIRADRVGPETGGAGVIRKLVLGPHILGMVGPSAGSIYTIGPSKVGVPDTVGAAHVGMVPFPTGYKVTLFEAWAERSGASSANVELAVIDAPTGARTSLGGILTTGAAGIQTLTSASLNHVMLDTQYLEIRAFSGSANTSLYYGFRLTYEVPDLSKGY